MCTLVLCTHSLRARLGAEVNMHARNIGCDELNLSRPVTVSKNHKNQFIIEFQVITIVVKRTTFLVPSTDSSRESRI